MQLVDEKELSPSHKKYLNRLIEKSTTFLPTSIVLNDFSDEAVISLVYAYFLAKYLRTMRAIILLLDNVFAEDAFMLSRSLFEIWVKILYTDQHPQEAVALYKIQFADSMHKDIERYRKVHKSQLSSDFDYIDLEVKVFEEHKRLIEETKVEKFSLIKNLDIDSHTFWPGKSVCDMLNEIDPELKWFYEIGYGMPSDFLHGNINALTNYLKFVDTHAVPIEELKHCYSVSTASAISGMLIHVLRLVNAKFCYKREEDINQLDKEAKEIFKT